MARPAKAGRYVLIRALGTLYGAAATWRRRWYSRHPERQRRLARPVISVGNLGVGGSGKTPIVEHIARLLAAAGERPSILTRGYGRQVARPGSTVVSDGVRVVGCVAESGDEPLMLARALEGRGVAVVVGADRYVSGLLAENRLGATVHILDDGFQHAGLARDVDLLATSEDDLGDFPMPAGRLREALAGAVDADAALVDAGYLPAAERVGRALGISTVFRVTRALEPPRMVKTNETVVVPAGSRVFAFAGIARPDRFFSDLAAGGWDVVDALPFRDHHRFTRADRMRIERRARKAAAAIVLTTAKDAVRLAPDDFKDVPVAMVPLTAVIEPAEEFLAWVRGRLS
jgi:tetraacyldisaccharide 4'-kinase